MPKLQLKKYLEEVFELGLNFRDFHAFLWQNGRNFMVFKHLILDWSFQFSDLFKVHRNSRELLGQPKPEFLACSVPFLQSTETLYTEDHEIFSAFSIPSVLGKGRFRTSTWKLKLPTSHSLLHILQQFSTITATTCHYSACL